MWICKNQLGRRNLTDAQKTYLIGRQYEAQKMTVGGDRQSKAQNGPLKNAQTSELVAKEVFLQNSNKSQELTIKSPPFSKEP